MSHENKWTLFNRKQEQDLPKEGITNNLDMTSTKGLPDLETLMGDFERKENQLGLGDK